MGKYRICGVCGRKKPIDEALCSCNNLLINSPIVEEDYEPEPAQKSEIVSPKATPFPQKYKRCPNCGHLNIPHFSFCEDCGDSLEDVFDLVEAAPESENESSEKSEILSPFHAVSEGGISITLPIGESMIGRDGFMGDDITRLNRMYVSGNHLIVRCTEQELIITDVSRNGTSVNSTMIPKGQSVSVSFGDIIGLGGISCELDPYGYYITIV